MNAEIIPTPLEGAFLVRCPRFQDVRGCFVKTYHEKAFAAAGLKPRFTEEFYSTSARGVIRGMHFQIPPAQHDKYICCLSGAVMDVILDIRVGSPTYGRHHIMELSGENCLGLYLPAGFAHGFQSLTEGSLLLYKTTHVYEPSCDKGIRWDSFGCQWSETNPLISDRDLTFPGLDEFVSTFCI